MPDRLQDCIDTLGGGELAESLCRELDKKTRDRNLLPTRGYEGVAPGALVFKSDLTANGWRPIGKTFKKSIGDRTAIIVKRDGKFRVLLIRYNLHFVPHNGRLTYPTLAAAVDIAERFLNGDDSEFDPIQNGAREIRKNRGSMTKKAKSIREIARASVGIKPRVEGPLKRVTAADDPGDMSGADISQIVARALDPIKSKINDLAAQVGGAPVARQAPRHDPSQPDYGRLKRDLKAGRLKTRVKPAPRSSGYIMRTVPNSFDGSTGQPQKRLTIRSAVRRSLGLPYRPPGKPRTFTARQAIGVEAHKARLEGHARGINTAAKSPLVDRSGAIVDPITGLRFATRAAYAQWLEVNRPDPKRGVPFHAPK